ncbi:hypothetical protein GCM10009805_27320 [Leucobacter chromiireducens subsp. solipictus]
MHRLLTGLGEPDAGAAGVLRVRLSHREAALDGLLHQPRGARLIDADLLGECADALRLGRVSELPEEAKQGRAAEAAAGAVAAATPERRAAAGPESGVLAAPVSKPGSAHALGPAVAGRSAEFGAAGAAGVAGAAAVTAAAPQLGEGGDDLVRLGAGVRWRGVGGCAGHADILHAT